MKKASIITLILVLTATLFAGCRNMGNTTNSTTPSSSSTSTTASALPLPEITKPSTSTTPSAETDPSTTTMPGRSAGRPSSKGPRY